MRIARQSIWVGLSLSGLAMAIASFGGITPVFGALLQEAIDVAVILNALRASVPAVSDRRNGSQSSRLTPLSLPTPAPMSKVTAN